MAHHVLGHGGPLLEAVFINRPNQFTLELELDGQPIRAAMADRGRLISLLVPGCPILIEHRPAPHRKTSYQALAALTPDGTLVSLDTHLPNRLVARALAAGLVRGLPPYVSWKSEQKIGHSRFDFLLECDDHTRLILEVKSVGRIDPDHIARFPDAPTTRGARHVRHLADLHHSPHTQSALLFVIQGQGATAVEVDEATDPDFKLALSQAKTAGVLLLANACPITRAGIHWGAPVPVHV